jgi:hypothetical protein
MYGERRSAPQGKTIVKRWVMVVGYFLAVATVAMRIDGSKPVVKPDPPPTMADDSHADIARLESENHSVAVWSEPEPDGLLRGHGASQTASICSRGAGVRPAQ